MLRYQRKHLKLCIVYARKYAPDTSNGGCDILLQLIYEIIEICAVCGRFFFLSLLRFYLFNLNDSTKFSHINLHMNMTYT